MLTIATVKWGDRYGPEYVNRLYSMAARHSSHPFRAVCFTDDAAGLDPGIVVRALPGELAGWWNKLALFAPGAFPVDERVIYLDLDTVLVGSIEPLAAFAGDFALLRDFYRPRGLGSGVMLWRAGAMDRIWQEFAADGRPELPGGDQAYIEVVAHRIWGHRLPADLMLQNLYPGLFASYKADCADGPPQGAAVICFHGEPKPHNCGAAWVTQAWNVNRRNIAA